MLTPTLKWKCQSLYSSLRCRRFLGSREYQNSLGLWCTCQKGQPFTIGHFRVPKILTFKTRLSAKPFLWKWVLFSWQHKVIFISMALHLASLWKRGLWQLRNGPFPPGGLHFFFIYKGMCRWTGYGFQGLESLSIYMISLLIKRLEQGVILDWKPFKDCQDLRWAVCICNTNNFFP